MNREIMELYERVRRDMKTDEGRTGLRVLLDHYRDPPAIDHGSDPLLVRTAFEEMWLGYYIHAIVTRFGDLCVLIHDDEHETVWQGDNVMAARAYINKLEGHRNATV